MEVKWLDGPEAADALNPLIEECGWIPLNGSSNPVITRARVAFDGDKVVGFFVVQLFPMVGPVLVSEKADPILGAQLLRDTKDFLEKSARGWLIVAENPRVAEFCEKLGYEKIDYPVYLGK